VLIAESVWPNAAHPFGRGINTLTGADAVAPYGGAAFHDNRVALDKVAPSEIAALERSVEGSNRAGGAPAAGRTEPVIL
jgi:hypothetical protein